MVQEENWCTEEGEFPLPWCIIIGGMRYLGNWETNGPILRFSLFCGLDQDPKNLIQDLESTTELVFQNDLESRSAYVERIFHIKIRYQEDFQTMLDITCQGRIQHENEIY